MEIGAERAHLDLTDGDQRHRLCMVERERHVAMELFLQQEGRGDAPERLAGSPDLDRSVVGMLDLVPRGQPLVVEKVAEESGPPPSSFVSPGQGLAKEILLRPELVGEANDSESAVEPVELAAPNLVEVLPEDERAVSREHLLAARADEGVEGVVDGVHSRGLGPR